MSTAIQLCSRALVMIGANPITALDGSDTSTEATVAAQIYETAVADLLSRSRWRFAAKQALLSPTTGTALTRWDATFDLPAGVLVIHALTLGGKRVEFDRYGDQIGAACLTTDAPVIDYGYRVAESLWPSYFDAYVELHLAAIFAYSIANQLDLSDYLEKKAGRAFAFAKNQDGQGRTTKKLETSRFLQVRGFSTGADDGYSGSSAGGGGDVGILLAGVRDGSLPGIDTPIPVANGGTGANTAAGARTSLGLGTIATQAASAVAITGGTITGITNLIATGGSINGTTVGSTTRAAGAFTTLAANGIVTVTGRINNTGNATDATSVGLRNGQVIQTGVTTLYAMQSIPSTAASATVGNMWHYVAEGLSLGGGATATNQVGFYATGGMTVAANNYGFRGDIPAATNRWNFYASGTANNAFAGNSRFGGVTAPNSTVDVTGNVFATTSILTNGATNGIGYSGGAGAAVTQATSRTTGVTINNVCGRITLFSTTTTAGTFASFTVTNSAVASTDVVIVNIGSGATANSYSVTVSAVATGSFRVQIANAAAVAVAEAPVLNFAVIKAVAA